MDSLLISGETQRIIFAILSSVLHLGNVNFTGKDEAKVDEKSTDSIQTVSRCVYKLKNETIVISLNYVFAGYWDLILTVLLKRSRRGALQ